MKTAQQGATTLSYGYDGLDNRISMTEGTVTTNYLLDLNSGLSRVLRESKGSDTYDYLYGLGAIGIKSGTAWRIFGMDALGSIRHLTDTNGSLLARADYDPFGARLEVTGQRAALPSSHGYTGELTDPFGMVNLRARVYNPRNYAFLTRDPVEGFRSRSASRNGYGYVEGNPVNWTDPSGRCVGLLLVICVGAAKALAIGAAAAGGFATAAVVNDIRGQVWYNQTQRGMSFGEAFNHLDRAALLNSAGAAAEFGFMMGFGFGIGGIISKVGLTGARAFAVGAAADVGFGVAWDMGVHGYTPSEALGSNLLGFGLGEVLGYGIRAFRRGAKAAADSIKLLPAPKISGLLPDRTIPLAFESEDAYRTFSTRLRGMLERAGYDDAEIIFQGSAVTGKRYTTGLPFGKDSDIDIAIASPSMLDAAKSQRIQIRGIHSRPLRMGDMRKLGIDGNELNELRKMVQHNPRYMIYKSTWSAINDKPSIIAPR